MKLGKANLPYSNEALQILANTLGVEISRLWLDPVTNRISIKQFDHEPTNRAQLK